MTLIARSWVAMVTGFANMRRQRLVAGGVVALVVSVALVACGGGEGNDAAVPETTAGGTTLQTIDPADLAEMLNAKDFPLINVHIPYEGEIDSTDLFIPFDQIEQNVDRLPDDTQAKIVLYCRSGAMSQTAGETLIRLGYTNVWHLNGGMIAWEAAGYPLLMREGSVDAIVP